MQASSSNAVTLGFPPMQTFWIGLVLALASAVAVNWAYAKEHSAAVALPPLSLREPRRSLGLLLGARAWVLAFAVETAGWLVYVAALRLAPLALVQAVCAAGIAVLAFVSVGGRVSSLSRREQMGVVIAFAGMLLLALSLSGPHQADRAPDALGVVLWLGACGGGAAAAASFPLGSRDAGLGFAAGLLFAGGDISAKLVGYGGRWFLVLLPLVVCYGLGTSVLQGAFQRGRALTAAGVATLTTNAVPIAAGFVLFGESLPSGAEGALQIAALAVIVVSATLLGRPEGRSRSEEPQATRSVV